MLLMNAFFLYDEEFEYYEEEFPDKQECRGSLSRKRMAMRVEYFKFLRMDHLNYLYGAWPRYKDGSWDHDPKEKPLYFQRGWRGKRSKVIKKYCSRKIRHKYKRIDNWDNACCRAKAIKHKETEYWWELD